MSLSFQIHSWNTYHEKDIENDYKYVIQIFGRTIDDKDVYLKVENFTPYFYIKVSDDFSEVKKT